MLDLLLFGGILLLLALQELFVILLRLRICLLLRLGFAAFGSSEAREASDVGATSSTGLGLFSYVLQYLFNHLLSLLLFGEGLALSLGVQGLHHVGLGLLKGLLGCILGRFGCGCRCLWGSGRRGRCWRWLLGRVGYGRLSSLLGFLGLRVLPIINWRLLLLSLRVVGLGHLGGRTLSSGVVSRLIIVSLRSLHHLSLLRIFSLLSLDLRKLIICRFVGMWLLFAWFLLGRLLILPDRLRFLLFGGLL